MVLRLPVKQDTLDERTGKKAVADDAKERIVDNPTKRILAVGNCDLTRLGGCVGGLIGG